MNVNEYDPRFPEVGPEPIFAPTAYGGRLLSRLRDLFRLNAQVTRELQSPPYFYVIANTLAAHAIPSAAYTVVPFGTVRYDTNGWWDAANNRYFTRESGLWQFHWGVLWYADSAVNPTAGYQAGLATNGGTIGVGSIATKDAASGLQYFSCVGSCILEMDGNPNKAGGADYAQIKVYQNTGAAEDIQLSGSWTYFQGVYRGIKRRNNE